MAALAECGERQRSPVALLEDFKRDVDASFVGHMEALEDLVRDTDTGEMLVSAAARLSFLGRRY